MTTTRRSSRDRNDARPDTNDCTHEHASGDHVAVYRPHQLEWNSLTFLEKLSTTRIGVHAKAVALISAVATILSLCLETTMRRNRPDSLFRPSILVSRLAKHSRWFFERTGYYVGMFTDVFYVVREIFKEDLMNILCALKDLFFSVFYFFRGYSIYFGALASEVYTYYSDTSLVLGTAGTAIVAIAVAFSFRWIIRRTKSAPEHQSNDGLWHWITRHLSRSSAT